RLSGGLRCHALGPAPGRAGRSLGWRAPVCPGPGARGRRGRRGRAVHGDSRGPGPHAAGRAAALRRTEHASPGRSAAPARRDRRHRGSGGAPVTDYGPLLARAARVLRLEAEAVLALVDRLDASFGRAVDLLQGCTGRVVVTGMGKSGLIGRKIAATLASTGTPADFLHPAEGVHGDIGMLTRGDVICALSNSGETDEVLAVLPAIKRLGIPLLLLTGTPASTLARQADVVLDVGVPEEACPMNLAPTA